MSEGKFPSIIPYVRICINAVYVKVDRHDYVREKRWDYRNV